MLTQFLPCAYCWVGTADAVLGTGRRVALRPGQPSAKGAGWSNLFFGISVSLPLPRPTTQKERGDPRGSLLRASLPNFSFVNKTLCITKRTLLSLSSWHSCCLLERNPASYQTSLSSKNLI